MSDLQQMQQQYQLIAENNGDQQQGDFDLESKYEELNEQMNDAYRQMAEIVEKMHQFLDYAESFDYEIDFDGWAENWNDACRDLF